jgi:hypothetical protein
MKNRTWMVVLGALILIAGLAGIGYLIYQAGVTQGAALGAEAFEFTRPIMGPRPLLTGILGFIALLFLLKLVTRLIFFPFFAYGMGRRHWRRHHPGMYGKWGYESDPPPFFRDWHERAHTDPVDEPKTEDS